MQIIASLFSQA